MGGEGRAWSAPAWGLGGPTTACRPRSGAEQFWRGAHVAGAGDPAVGSVEVLGGGGLSWRGRPHRSVSRDWDSSEVSPGASATRDGPRVAVCCEAVPVRGRRRHTRAPPRACGQARFHAA